MFLIFKKDKPIVPKTKTKISWLESSSSVRRQASAWMETLPNQGFMALLSAFPIKLARREICFWSEECHPIWDSNCTFTSIAFSTGNGSKFNTIQKTPLNSIFLSTAWLNTTAKFFWLEALLCFPHNNNRKIKDTSSPSFPALTSIRKIGVELTGVCTYEPMQL